jgi:hypothetical protein
MEVLVVVLTVILAVLTLVVGWAVRRLERVEQETHENVPASVRPKMESLIGLIYRLVSYLDLECDLEFAPHRETPDVIGQFQRQAAATATLIERIVQEYASVPTRFSLGFRSRETASRKLVQSVRSQIEKEIVEPLKQADTACDRKKLFYQVQEALKRIVGEVERHHRHSRRQAQVLPTDAHDIEKEKGGLLSLKQDLDTALNEMQNLLDSVSGAVSSFDLLQINGFAMDVCHKSREIDLACARASVSEITWTEDDAERAQQILASACDRVKQLGLLEKVRSDPEVKTNVDLIWRNLQIRLDKVRALSNRVDESISEAA